MSLVDNNYNGAYKCWSCRAMFTLKVQHDEIESIVPLSQEEYEKAHPPKPSFNMNVGDARTGGSGSRPGNSGPTRSPQQRWL
jgi:hypothetical protein